MITCPSRNDWSLLQKLSYETNKRLQKQAQAARQLKEKQELLHQQVLDRLRAHRRERIEFLRKNFDANPNRHSDRKNVTNGNNFRCYSSNRCQNIHNRLEKACSKNEINHDMSRKKAEENSSDLFEEAMKMVAESARSVIKVDKSTPKNFIQKFPSTLDSMLPDESHCSPACEDRSSASVVAIADSPHSVDLEDTPHGFERLQEGTECRSPSVDQHALIATPRSQQDVHEKIYLTNDAMTKHPPLQWLRTGTPPLDSPNHPSEEPLETTDYENASQVRVSKQVSCVLTYATCTIPIVMAAPVYTMAKTCGFGNGPPGKIGNPPVSSAQAQSEERARPVLLCNPFFVSHKSSILTSDQIKPVNHASEQTNYPTLSIGTSECPAESQGSDVPNFSPAIAKSSPNIPAYGHLYCNTDSLDAAEENVCTNHLVCQPFHNNTEAESLRRAVMTATTGTTNRSTHPMICLDARRTRDSLEVTTDRLFNGKSLSYPTCKYAKSTRSPRKTVRFSDSEETKADFTKFCSHGVVCRAQAHSADFCHTVVRSVSGSSPRPVRVTGPVISVICPQPGVEPGAQSTPSTIEAVRFNGPTKSKVCNHLVGTHQELIDCENFSDVERNLAHGGSRYAYSEKVNSKPPVIIASHKQMNISAKGSPSNRACYANLFIGRAKVQHRLNSFQSPSMREASPSAISTPPSHSRNALECISVTTGQPANSALNSASGRGDTEHIKHVKYGGSTPKLFTAAKLDEIAARICRNHRGVETRETVEDFPFGLVNPAGENFVPDEDRLTTTKGSLVNSSGQGDDVDFQQQYSQIPDEQALQKPGCCTHSPKIRNDRPICVRTVSRDNLKPHLKCGHFDGLDENNASQKHFTSVSHISNSRSTFALNTCGNEGRESNSTETSQLGEQLTSHPQCDLPNIHSGLRVGVWRLLRRRPRISESNSLCGTKHLATVLQDSHRVPDSHSSRSIPENSDASVQAGETQITISQALKPKQQATAIFPNLAKLNRSKSVFNNSATTRIVKEHLPAPTNQQAGDGSASLRENKKTELTESLADFVETESVCCQTQRLLLKPSGPIPSRANPAHCVQSKFLLCNGYGAPSTISMEEARLLQSLEKLNTRLCVILSDRH